MFFKAIVAMFLVTCFILSCGTKPENTTIMTDDNCGLANFNYQEVTDTTHIIKSGGLQTGGVVNGPVVINPNIKVDSVGAYIRGGGKVLIDQKTSKVFRVSQDFWEKFTRMRSSLCALKQGLKDSTLVDDSIKREAQRLFIQINRMFSGLDEAEERRKIEEEKRKLEAENRTAPNTFQLDIPNIDLDDYKKIASRIERTSKLTENNRKNYQYKVAIEYDNSCIQFDSDYNAWKVHGIPIKISINDRPARILGTIRYSGSSTEKDYLEKVSKDKMVAFLKGYNYNNILKYE